MVDLKSYLAVVRVVVASVAGRKLQLPEAYYRYFYRIPRWRGLGVLKPPELGEETSDQVLDIYGAVRVCPLALVKWLKQ